MSNETHERLKAVESDGLHVGTPVGTLRRLRVCRIPMGGPYARSVLSECRVVHVLVSFVSLDHAEGSFSDGAKLLILW